MATVEEVNAQLDSTKTELEAIAASEADLKATVTSTADEVLKVKQYIDGLKAGNSTGGATKEELDGILQQINALHETTQASKAKIDADKASLDASNKGFDDQIGAGATPNLPSSPVVEPTEGDVAKEPGQD